MLLWLFVGLARAACARLRRRPGSQKCFWPPRPHAVPFFSARLFAPQSPAANKAMFFMKGRKGEHARKRQKIGSSFQCSGWHVRRNTLQGQLLGRQKPAPRTGTQTFEFPRKRHLQDCARLSWGDAVQCLHTWGPQACHDPLHASGKGCPWAMVCSYNLSAAICWRVRRCSLLLPSIARMSFLSPDAWSCCKRLQTQGLKASKHNMLKNEEIWLRLIIIFKLSQLSLPGLANIWGSYQLQQLSTSFSIGKERILAGKSSQTAPPTSTALRQRISLAHAADKFWRTFTWTEASSKRRRIPSPRNEALWRNIL